MNSKNKETDIKAAINSQTANTTDHQYLFPVCSADDLGNPQGGNIRWYERAGCDWRDRPAHGRTAAGARAKS